jgi:AcrR family transcriptional regulator
VVEAREEKRARIVQGALELITRYGLHKTTLEDIASQARLKPSSVYYYFASKEEVFAAVIRQAAEDVLSKVRAAVDAAEGAEAKLVAFFHARYSYLALLGGVTQAVALELYPKAEGAIAEFEGRGQALLTEILRQGVAAGELHEHDADALGRGIVLGMRGMDSMFVVHKLHEEAMEGLYSLLDVFLRGLREDGGSR